MPLKKYKVGVMSNVWEIEAENADIAVASTMIWLQSGAPVAIYDSEETSQFQAGEFGADVKALENFIEDNKSSIKEAIKTIKESPSKD